MAKKKDLGISAEMLMGLNEQSEFESQKIRKNKGLREKDEEEIEMSYELEKGRDARYAKPQVKKFDRKKERPIQKTVHLTIEVDNKVNMVKSLLKTMGKKTTFEDFLFDLLDTWLKEHYNEVLNGKLVYPGEK